MLVLKVAFLKSNMILKSLKHNLDVFFSSHFVGEETENEHLGETASGDQTGN
jgi:hypothetical protein